MPSTWPRPVLVALLVFLFIGCSSLPGHIPPSEESFALSPGQEGDIATFASRCDERTSTRESCFLLLSNNIEDLRWRLALIDSARVSIDVQTYVWARDFSGSLLASRVLAAADRGVRVRLLIDDFPSRGSDRLFAVLDQHPNIGVRIWNPATQRRLGRNLEYVFRLGQLNHRLHNKVLIADNQVFITGGRNLADAYFGLSDQYNFLDIDLLTTGPVVQPVSEMFDLFWNNPQAIPGSNFHSGVSAGDVGALRDHWRQQLDQSPLGDIVSVVPRIWTSRFEKAIDTVAVGEAQLIHDMPGQPAPTQDALIELQQWVRGAQREVFALNPYLVPGEFFFGEAIRLEERGVDMAIMTNSLGSTNQTIVHAAFARRRLPLLEAGVRLFEMKYHPAMQGEIDTAPVRSRWVGLHAKCAVLDREQVFIGSYNFSPRSRDLNIEMGIVVSSEQLGSRLAAVMDQAMSPQNAWEVRQGDTGELSWVSVDGVRTAQPSQNLWRRISAGFFGLFPVEQYL